MQATFKKLRDGGWGISVRGGPVSPGTPIDVRLRDGGTKRVTVGRVLWSGDGVCVCSIVPDGKRGRSGGSNGSNRSGRCRGCGGPIQDAAHHRAMEGYCGSCAFDEFDY